MKSCSGIEGLKDLKDVALGNCPRPESISSMSGLHHLRNIDIESCRKITDYELLIELPKIEIIQLINCGQNATISLATKS